MRALLAMLMIVVCGCKTVQTYRPARTTSEALRVALATRATTVRDTSEEDVELSDVKTVAIYVPQTGLSVLSIESIARACRDPSQDCLLAHAEKHVDLGLQVAEHHFDGEVALGGAILVVLLAGVVGSVYCYAECSNRGRAIVGVADAFVLIAGFIEVGKALASMAPSN